MRLFYILGFLFCCLFTHAQIDKQNIVLDARWFRGDLKKPDAHTQAILETGTVQNYELRIGRRDLDSSYFAISSRHPIFGLGFSVVDFSRARMIDEPRTLGNLYSLYGYIDRTLFQFKPVSFGYSFEAGLAYNTDVYDSITALNKIFSSSPIMVYIGLGLHLKYRLSDHWEIGTLVGAKHYSNGKFGIWNKGMNILGGEASLRYYFSPLPENHPRTYSSDFKRHFYWNVFAGGGGSTYLEDLRLDNYVASNKKYPVYTKYFISMDAMYRWSFRYACGLGMDFFYVPSMQSFKQIDERRFGREVFADIKYSAFSTGIAFNQELYYKNLAVTASLGYYLYRELGRRIEESPIYQRFGFRYYFPRMHNLFLGASIKAHRFNKAEYFEFSIGKRTNF
jgi:hypothetical protein